MKRVWLLLAAILLFVASFASIVTAESGLTEVAKSVPLLLQPVTIAYTDWVAIKASLGVPSLTSEAPLEDRIAFALSLDLNHAVGSAFGWGHLDVHADTWGFDITDFEWEAQVIATGIPSTYLLKLREDFDLDALVGRFVERGFVQTESHGATIYSRSVDLHLAWARASEFAIHCTAVLEDEKLLILSSSLPVVELLLATRAGELGNCSEIAAVEAAINHLADPFAAYLLVGASTCLRFNPNPLLATATQSDFRSALDELRAWWESDEPLHAYNALAVGYRHEDGAPIGTIAFAYASSDVAEHDVDPRRLLAESGGSAHYERPISEAYFTIENAWAEESSILFTVRPFNDQPRRLFQMVVYADAPFAGCR